MVRAISRQYTYSLVLSTSTSSKGFELFTSTTGTLPLFFLSKDFPKALCKLQGWSCSTDVYYNEIGIRPIVEECRRHPTGWSLLSIEEFFPEMTGMSKHKSIFESHFGLKSPNNGVKSATCYNIITDSLCFNILSDKSRHEPTGLRTFPSALKYVGVTCFTAFLACCQKCQQLGGRNIMS